MVSSLGVSVDTIPVSSSEGLSFPANSVSSSTEGLSVPSNSVSSSTEGLSVPSNSVSSSTEGLPFPSNSISSSTEGLPFPSNSISSSTEGFLFPSNSVISSCSDINSCFELDFFFSPKNSSIVSSEALTVAVGTVCVVGFSTRLAVPLAGFVGVAFVGVVFVGEVFVGLILDVVGLVAILEIEDGFALRVVFV